MATHPASITLPLSASRFDSARSAIRRERGCFLVVQTLWAEKIQSTTDAGSLNTFGRNEIEVAPISSALLGIACLVILYKTCRIPDQELAADGVIRTGMGTRARLLKQNENRHGGAAPWSYLVLRSYGSRRARLLHSCQARSAEHPGYRQSRCDRFRSDPGCPRPFCARLPQR